MQLTYQQNFDAAFAGMSAYSGPSLIEGHPNGDANTLSFGTGLVWCLTLIGAVRAPRLNFSTLTVSTDLIAANSTIVTVNGVSTTATVYASSHAATMAQIAVKVAALSTCDTCTVSGDGLLITGFDDDLVTSAVTTLGSSQPTWSAVYTSVDTIAGAAGFEQKDGTLESVTSATAEGGVGASGGIGFYNTQIVPVIRRDTLWVPITVNVNAGDTMYIITAATNRGKFTNVSTGNIKAGKCRLAGTTAGLGIAICEFDIPAMAQA